MDDDSIKKHHEDSVREEVPDVPTLIKYISSNEVADFDINIEEVGFLDRPSDHDPIHDFQTDLMNEEYSQLHSMNHQRKPSMSISMPVSPLESHSRNTKRVYFGGETDFQTKTNSYEEFRLPSEDKPEPELEPVKFFSQPIPSVISGSATTTFGVEQTQGINFVHPSIKKLKDKRFDSFKTWSGALERQITSLRRKQPKETGPECQDGDITQERKAVGNVPENIPVHRYFDALEGPELETLRASEEMVLPHDKTWPFLLRYPISSFGICLGIGSQAVMWKTLATSVSTKYLHISLKINLVLWIITIALIAIVSFIYLLKVILYFEAVRREYYHPIRVNFFFAPWIALLFLALGAPPSIAEDLHPALWYVLMAPICCLEIKIYGQWMSGGQRRLSKVANPSNHLSIVGNFVGALLGASMGLKEGPIFFFAVGLAHYSVLFVTLYQRLPTNETLPKELHPVFFLFVAAPSVASMAWARIQGSFDYGSRIAYFIALFLYFSLAVRINFFRGFKFSLAWWAYTFPMTGAAIATIRYSNEVTSIVARALTVILSTMATLTVTALLVTTILHAFVLRDLFPNDIAIAISDRKVKPHRNWFHQRHGSTDSRDIEKFLKFSDPNGKDLEASVEQPGSEQKKY